MVLTVLLILLGFALLTKGADFLVEGACAVARRFRVSDMVIGLTIVALGTSAPELVVSIVSAFGDEGGGIAIGNVMGSNIANLCLVLGVAGVLVPISIKKGTVWKEIPFCLASSVMLWAGVMFLNTDGTIGRLEAIVYLVVLVGYLAFMFRAAKEPPPHGKKEKSRPLVVSILLMAGGLAGLLIGGQLIVRNGVRIAETMHVSKEMIGLTVVALGTSLPELAAGVAAVVKGKPDIALGNVVGSNIINICLVLGVSGALKPLRTAQSFVIDGAVLVFASVLLFIFMFTGKRQKLDRTEAWLFLATYAGYMAYVIVRR